MKVKIHKILGGKGMRTQTMVGDIVVMRTNDSPQESRLPEVGEVPFISNATPLSSPGVGARVLNTSMVAKYHDVDGGRQITTRTGSIYFIEPL